MKKYLIPSRLNEKYTIWGFTPIEILAILISFLISILSQQFYLLIVPAFIFATFIRFINGEENIWQYGKKVYNYFFKVQSFSIIGGD